MDSQDSLQKSDLSMTGAIAGVTKVEQKVSEGNVDRVAVLGNRAHQKQSTKTSTDGSVSKVGINRQTVFSLEQARDVVAVISSITRSYSRRVDALIDRLDALVGSNETATIAIEAQVDSLIQEWQGKVRKLGALPQGLWIADIDSGDGYFCWKFPEPTVQFWHGYTDGFSKRRPVDGSTAFVPLKKTAEPDFKLSPSAPMRMVSVACPPALQRMEIPE